MYIRARKLWGAKPPKSVTREDWKKKTGMTVVAHHSAGAAPKLQGAVKEELRSEQRFHQVTRGWVDIGYNYSIDVMGRIWECRGFGVVGAHTANHNHGTIGICFQGNYTAKRLNKLQLKAYHWLVHEYLKGQGVKVVREAGHRQMPDQSTACPGKYIIEQLDLH